MCLAVLVLALLHDLVAPLPAIQSRSFSATFLYIHILSFPFFLIFFALFFWAIMIDSQRCNADRLGSGNQIRNGAWVGVWRIQSSPMRGLNCIISCFLRHSL